MNGNPFYVDPGTDYSHGLAGLAQSFNYLGEQKAKQRAKEKYEKMKMEGTAAFATKDPDKIAEFMIKNPEMAKAMDISYGFYDKATKENYLNGAYKILEAHENLKREGGGTITPSVVPPPITAAGEYPYDPSILGLEEPPGTPFLNAESEPIPASELPPEIDNILQERKNLLKAKGVPPEQTRQTDAFAAAYTTNPEAAIQKIEHDIATMDPKGWKAWKEIYRPTEKEGSSTQLNKWINEREALLAEGYSENDPKVKAYSNKIWPEGEDKEITPSNLAKMMGERDALIDTLQNNGYEDPAEHPDVIAYNRKILGEKAKTFSPSPLKKVMDERNVLADELRDKGLDEEQIANHPYIKAYDNKIAGIDIDIDELTQEEVDYWGAWVNLNGKMPSVGRGKQATKIRAAIIKSAAKQAYEQYGLKYPEKKTATPTKAALEVIGMSADTKSIQSALTVLEKQTASMGSFIQNLDEQITQVGDLAKDLPLVDTRLLNVPIRALHKKILGNPELAKYEMYLTEIAREIGRLSSGSPQSIAELSTHAQEKWDKIHDPNLSVKDMLSLLEETRHAANIRMSSVEDQLERTRIRMRTREYPGQSNKAPLINTQEEYNALPSGSWYTDPDSGKPAQKR
jgi:flagellin-like hook-associated protein FlgL